MNNTNPPALEVRNLGKSFGKTEVLRGISFTLERGAVLAALEPLGGAVYRITPEEMTQTIVD